MRWLLPLIAAALVPAVIASQPRPQSNDPHQGEAQVDEPTATRRSQGPELPTDPTLPRTVSGRHYPLVPEDSAALATLLAALESAIRDPQLPGSALPPLAHQQQVIYRVLSKQPKRAAAVRSALPERWHWVFDQHIAARRQFLAMHRGPASNRLPAWRIRPPAPADQLLKAYRSAAAQTGID